MKRTLPDGTQSALWKEVDAHMEFLLILLNSNRRFFRVGGGVEATVKEHLEHSSLGYEVARQEMIDSVLEELNFILDIDQD